MAGIFGTFEVRGFLVQLGGVRCGRTGGDATYDVGIGMI